LWRCGDGLFFEVPPLASGALLKMLQPLLEIFRRIVKQAVLSPVRSLQYTLNWIHLGLVFDVNLF
jgi:hypothetical protein